MFSHALVAYQSALFEFFTKTSETYRNTLTVLKKEPSYNFTVLKELTQGNPDEEDPKTEQSQTALDSDQMLFFKVKFYFSIIFMT